MKNMIKYSASLALGAMVLALATTASATTLAQLDGSQGSGSLASGSFTFNNFTYSNPGGYAPSDSAITVSTVNGTNAGGSSNTGVRFSANWTSSSGSVDSIIGYQAHLAATNMAINSVYLDFNGATINNTGGNAFATVTETVQDATTGANLGQLTVYQGNISTGITNISATTLKLNGNYTDLLLTKDILVTATPSNTSANPATATISFVDNGFNEVNTGGPPPVVPEPASLMLIPLGLIGLAARRKLARPTVA